MGTDYHDLIVTWLQLSQSHVTFYNSEKMHSFGILNVRENAFPKFLKALKSSNPVLPQKTIHHFEADDMENTEMIITQFLFFPKGRQIINSCPIKVNHTSF
jgi:hypothetical protein